VGVGRAPCDNEGNCSCTSFRRCPGLHNRHLMGQMLEGAEEIIPLLVACAAGDYFERVTKETAADSQYIRFAGELSNYSRRSLSGGIARWRLSVPILATEHLSNIEEKCLRRYRRYSIRVIDHRSIKRDVDFTGTSRRGEAGTSGAPALSLPKSGIIRQVLNAGTMRSGIDASSVWDNNVEVVPLAPFLSAFTDPDFFWGRIALSNPSLYNRTARPVFQDGQPRLAADMGLVVTAVL